MLSSRGVQPNRCSPNLQKIQRNCCQQQNPWKIYLSEFMLLYLHRKNENYKITSQLSLKLFAKFFWSQLFCRIPLRCVFRTQSKIYDWALFAKIVNVNFFRKKTSSEMFDWVLNTPLPLDGYYLRGLSSLCVHTIFQNVSKM